MIRPTMEEVKEYARIYPVVPVGMEIYSDIKTPIQVLRNLKERSDRCFLLESVEGGEKWGRYSFLGFNPKLCVKGGEGLIEIEDFEHRTKRTEKLDDGVRQSAGAPIDILRQIIREYRSPKPDYFPNFTGGFVGYFSYDFIRYTEEGLLLENRNEPGFDDFNLMLYDKVIVFDHLRQKILIIVNIDASDPEKNYLDAVIGIKEIENIIRDSSKPADLKARVDSPFRPLMQKDEYCDRVQQAKHHIHEGDIFQAVLSNRFEADFSGDLLPVFRALRTINPSPYMFYVSTDGLQVTGASPETLVKLHNGKLCTYPIAGTCPRGETPEEDERLIADLLKNEKELAEHNMLVDLGRNDLGKVSRFGSVKVEEYQKIVRYSHVSHISSTVSGLLRDGADCFDAMAAVLPAGTLSGAPKRRACEIINRLEGHKRGIYGGAVGYIDFGGNMDLCIAIRMAVQKDGKIYVQSGAGIVADSIPENEYRECISKSKAMMDAVLMAGEALQ
ncbi:MAG: anthranilate synthase component I [Saccharofermentanales bacterium]